MARSPRLYSRCVTAYGPFEPGSLAMVNAGATLAVETCVVPGVSVIGGAPLGFHTDTCPCGDTCESFVTSVRVRPPSGDCATPTGRPSTASTGCASRNGSGDARSNVTRHPPSAGSLVPAPGAEAAAAPALGRLIATGAPVAAQPARTSALNAAMARTRTWIRIGVAPQVPCRPTAPATVGSRVL